MINPLKRKEEYMMKPAWTDWMSLKKNNMKRDLIWNSDKELDLLLICINNKILKKEKLTSNLTESLKMRKN